MPQPLEGLQREITLAVSRHDRALTQTLLARRFFVPLTAQELTQHSAPGSSACSDATVLRNSSFSLSVQRWAHSHPLFCPVRELIADLHNNSPAVQRQYSCQMLPPWHREGHES